MKLIAEPLTAEAFAPYGDVVIAPADAGRSRFDAALATLRPNAAPSLSVAVVPPTTSLPLDAVRMERHEFSSQTFLPLDPVRYLVIVAPKAADGGPDGQRARAFLASPGQGITYRHDTWHHPLTVLDQPARFAIFMWLDGSSTDEEFVPLAHPFTVDIPG